MRRWYLLVGGVVIVAGFALLARPGRSQWSTASKEAVRELELGLEAQQKVYYAEAIAHFERALEADPGLLVAKTLIAQHLESNDSAPRRAALVEELRQADLSRLNPRERFLTKHFLARFDHDGERGETLLRAYMKDYPDDPFALSYRAGRAMYENDWEAATRDYLRLIEVAPNWVVAYNQLGYLAMAQGKFDEAETMLRKYRFIAPDQANPHDSLAELLVLTGRYGEAESELEEALRVKPDFCASFEHLLDLYLLSNQLDRVDETLDRAAADRGCEPAMVARMRRDATLWKLAYGERWSDLLDAARDEHSGYGGSNYVLAHTALARLGRLDEAAALADELEKQVTTLQEAHAPASKVVPLAAAVTHMEGVRLLVSGRQGEAAAAFSRADALLVWRNISEGIFKLYNLALQAKAARAAGDRRAAEAITTTLRSVNPRFAEDVTEGRSIITRETGD